MAQPPDDDRLDLSFLLNQAAYAFEARLGGALAELGISVRDYCVLWKAYEGERTQAQIGELAGLDKSTMTLTVDRLTTAGLVERRVSDLDRRARVVGLTAAGLAAYEEGARVVDEVTRTTLAFLGGRPKADFVRLLSALVEDGPLGSPSHVAPLRRKQARPHVETSPTGG